MAIVDSDEPCAMAMMFTSSREIALKIRPAYERFDAEKRFGLVYKSVPDHKQCECGAILRGVKRPTDCKLFGTVCTPETPMGSCMVSSEGACAAHYTYGRFRDIAVVAA